MRLEFKRLDGGSQVGQALPQHHVHHYLEGLVRFLGHFRQLVCDIIFEGECGPHMDIMNQFLKVVKMLSKADALMPTQLMTIPRLFCFIGLAIPILAQNQLTVQPTSCVYKEGDDPSWAKPDFDDHDWSPTRPDLQRPAESPHYWMRCRFDLRPLARTGQTRIQVETFAAWQMFIDGELAGAFGDIDSGRISMDLAQRRPLPAGAGEREEVLLALRLADRSRAGTFARKTPPFVLAGDDRLLESESLGRFAGKAGEQFLNYFFSAVIGSAGLFLLILFRADRTRRDLFWLAMTAVAVGVFRINELVSHFQLSYPYWLDSLLYTLSNGLLFVGQVIFFFALAGRRVPMLYRLLTVLTITHLLLTLAAHLFGSLSLSQSAIWWAYLQPEVRTVRSLLLIVLATAPLAAFWPFWRVPKGSRLLFAICVLWMSGVMANFFAQLPWISQSTLIMARNYLSIARTPAIFGMFFLLARRQREVYVERAELQSEMKAAQQMQRLLVPAELDLEPWVAVEVAYFPAKEVGGDFYFCRRTSAGQLIVVGDVSGKGLKAAMVASTLVGALRNEDLTDPALVLGRLNRVVLESNSGGFVTCLCALLREDGTFVFANAGHISPYLGGLELEAAAGLPLGISAEVDYESASAHLNPGQAITLMSDGVVEAANAQDELFGFERTLKISCRTAAEIAEVARAWGQNDDITVLTVRRSA